MEISSLNCYFVAFHRLIIGKGRSRETELVNQILAGFYDETNVALVQTPPGVISPLVCLIGKLTLFIVSFVFFITVRQRKQYIRLTKSTKQLK